MPRISQSRVDPIQLNDPKDVGELLRVLNEVLLPVLSQNADEVDLGMQPISSIQDLVATDRVAHEVSTVQVAGNGGAITLTSVPTISAGYDGERLLILGTHDTNTITLQDVSNLTGSLLNLAGNADWVGGAGDTLYLIYSDTIDGWCEVSRSGN